MQQTVLVSGRPWSAHPGGVPGVPEDVIGGLQPRQQILHEGQGFRIAVGWAGHFRQPDLAVEARVQLVQKVHHVADLARVVVRGQVVHSTSSTGLEKLLATKR